LIKGIKSLMNWSLGKIRCRNCIYEQTEIKKELKKPNKMLNVKTTGIAI